MDAYMGTILIWAPSFAPQSWAFCAGQIMSISQNTALYSLLGVTYGGNGTTTFALPNLQGRVPLGAGATGFGTYVLGEAAGMPNVTLGQANMPMHVHSGAGMSVAIQASTAAATASTPATGMVLAAANGSADGGESVTVRAYAASGGPTVGLAGGLVTGNTSIAGGSTPFSIMQPYLGLNFVICMFGIYPPRAD